MTTTDNGVMAVAVQGGVTATALAFFHDSVIAMIPFLLCCIPLVCLDLKFGIKAAKYRGARIRFSTAFRRTFGKCVEYLCWVVLSSTMSLAFSAKWIQWIVLGVVFVNEFSSIIGNYLETKGLEVSWSSVANAILKLFGQKHGLDTSGIDTGEFVKPKPAQRRDGKGRFVKTTEE